VARNQGLAKINHKDEIINRIQDNIATSVNQVVTNPINQGQLIQASLAGGSNAVPHKLGRVPQGYFIGSQSNASTIHETSRDSTFLNLTASSAVSVSLWIF
jgi:hypothetical protein